MKVGLTKLSLCISLAFCMGFASGQSKQALANKRSRLQQLIAASVEQLDNDEQRLDALQRLENLGALATPELKRLLHWQQRSELSRQQQADLLYVIGAMGKAGIPVLPELLTWLDEDDREVLSAIHETLSLLAAHLEDEKLAQIGAKLHNKPWGLLACQVQLGAQPTAHQLVACLRDYELQITAACRKINATPPTDKDAVEMVAAALRECLVATTRRTFFSMQRGSSHLSGEVAAAWLTLTANALDATAARGLLTHRLPQQRLRGVLWLEEHGPGLPAEERCDLVVRLWDGDAKVTATAAKALGNWQQAGILALPSLLLMAEQHASQLVRTAADQAAHSIAASLSQCAPTDQPWLLGAHAILSDQQAIAPTAPPSKQGKRLLAELLMMAQWQRPERLNNLLTFTDSAQPDRHMAGMVATWLEVRDPTLTDASLSWLARHAPQAIEAWDHLLQGDEPNTRWPLLVAYRVPKTCRGTALEATAWLQTRGAADSDYVDMLEDDNTRLQARALAELLLRPNKRLLDAAPRLRALANLAAKQQLKLQLSPFLPATELPYELAEPVRMLAVLALGHIERVAADQNDLAQLVRKHFGCALQEVPKHVADLAEAGTLDEQIERLESLCRDALFVPKQLQWPRAGQQPGK